MHCSVQNAAVFCQTIMIESLNFELAQSGNCLGQYFCFFVLLRVLLAMETLEDEHNHKFYELKDKIV